jgi:pSer/pThr/pTyr-binding forkhead associated (FHA) protein
MKIDTFFIFAGVFVILIILYFFIKRLFAGKDRSEIDLTTAIEDFNLPVDQNDIPDSDKIVGELELFIRDNKVSTTKIADRDIIVGRDPTQSTLIIPEPTVSKVHCRFYSRGNSVFIKDNNSTNGTLVNGSKIEEQELKSKDVIFLGKKGTVKLIYQPISEKSD